MFERFTDRARRVVVLAQEEARMLNHHYIGTEHIVLGLLHEGEGVACLALESLGISLDDVRQRVTEIIGHGQMPAGGHIPFTARAKKILEFAHREALQLGHDYISTEHVLLGIIREGEGVGAQVLVQLGADLSTVRKQVIQLLSGYADGKSPESKTVTGGTHAELSFRSAPNPTEMPLCPSCGRGLEGKLGYRSLSIGGTSRVLFAVYCTRCGVVIETRIEEPLT
jgi:ATP-dependent Clp protease ATP-binding subunit ClpC